MLIYVYGLSSLFFTKKKIFTDEIGIAQLRAALLQ
jgi:hypothetical protein